MSLRKTLPEEYLNGVGLGEGETPSCLRISFLLFMAPKGFNKALVQVFPGLTLRLLLCNPRSISTSPYSPAAIRIIVAPDGTSRK